MRIEIKLYGTLKKFAPGDRSQFTLSLEPGATPGRVYTILSIPACDHVLLVNGRRPDPDAKLADGDTLVFMPPIAGG